MLSPKMACMAASPSLRLQLGSNQVFAADIGTSTLRTVLADHSFPTEMRACGRTDWRCDVPIKYVLLLVHNLPLDVCVSISAAISTSPVVGLDTRVRSPLAIVTLLVAANRFGIVAVAGGTLGPELGNTSLIYLLHGSTVGARPWDDFPTLSANDAETVYNTLEKASLLSEQLLFVALVAVLELQLLSFIDHRKTRVVLLAFNLLPIGRARWRSGGRLRRNIARDIFLRPLSVVATLGGGTGNSISKFALPAIETLVSHLGICSTW
eukprot:gnl/TRDRNA2_/TRDRNA2_151561_c1_seq1.p1 gnl/TRDRNA2_/TRDRNA2_151561_c1~~gnl/TRDRNA2_/TRDRNA2_151561_c1_seq1.p1  ORF type:complete len:266 (-),score=4.03 gnl/TRDRNA2_/TRDRNA2_151561_c1_seq1:406-1203(-)